MEDSSEMCGDDVGGNGANAAEKTRKERDIMHGRESQAFTLIELLIVVAIIAILAAIAVPNFLEAQTRAKISRVQADFRSMATALESYRVDTNKYPPHYAMGCDNLFACPALTADVCLPRLTTPVAYITSVEACRDVFNDRVLTVRGPGLPGAGRTAAPRAAPSTAEQPLVPR